MCIYIYIIYLCKTAGLFGQPTHTHQVGLYELSCSLDSNPILPIMSAGGLQVYSR